MEREEVNQKYEEQRQQMIEFIVRTIQQIDDEKLRNIYSLVLHIS